MYPTEFSSIRPGSPFTQVPHAPAPVFTSTSSVAASPNAKRRWGANAALVDPVEAPPCRPRCHAERFQPKRDVEFERLFNVDDEAPPCLTPSASRSGSPMEAGHGTPPASPSAQAFERLFDPDDQLPARLAVASQSPGAHAAQSAKRKQRSPSPALHTASTAALGRQEHVPPVVLRTVTRVRAIKAALEHLPLETLIEHQPLNTIWANQQLERHGIRIVPTDGRELKRVGRDACFERMEPPIQAMPDIGTHKICSLVQMAAIFSQHPTDLSKLKSLEQIQEHLLSQTPAWRASRRTLLDFAEANMPGKALPDFRRRAGAGQPSEPGIGIARPATRAQRSWSGSSSASASGASSSARAGQWSGSKLTSIEAPR
ncbi:MAG: hypothetical protein JWQ11_3880 [Rhizobacter sp.]|nr:hypothetical protein [Rhizobacter sp.]